MSDNTLKIPWSPRFQCSVPPRPDAAPLRAPAPLDAAEREAVRRVVEERAGPHLSKAAAVLARDERSPQVAGLLGGVLADAAAGPSARALAAVELARMPAEDAEPALLRHLDEEDPEVRLRVVQALGATGREAALRALDGVKADTPALRAQAQLARRLVRHRLGVHDGGEDLSPRGTRWEPEVDGRPSRLPLRPLKAEETADRVRALAGQTYGVRLDERTAFAIGEPGAVRHVLLNREITGAEGWARLKERPAIVALVTLPNTATGAEAVQVVVLGTPRGGELLLRGYRTDGALVFDGLGRPAGREIPFTVVSADRPGQCRYRLQGRITPAGVEWERMETLPRRRAKRRTVSLVSGG